MKIAWPPPPLGLGTVLNLAYFSHETRRNLRRSWWLVAVVGVVTPFLMLAIDQMLFGGSSLQRVHDLGSEPLTFRLLVVLYSGVTEELVYRLVLATLVAWLAYLALSRVATNPKAAAQWLGIVVAATLFGLAHVGNLPNVQEPVLRAVLVNGVAGLAFGWLFFSRGLEVAILSHMLAILILYIGVPPFL